MSTRLALGGITAVLRQVLRNGVADLAAIVGAPVSVSAVAPDTINLQDAAAVPTLNLFLHRISPNAGWRNANLPSFGSDGAQAQSPPLALDLHYLLTAYGKTDLQAEILLGSGMQVLHERPWLTRDTIRDALAAVPLDHLPPETLDQADGIKISLEPMGTDDLSRLWSAMQAHY
ncbi:MAG TPA: DUF4255 domain-containing protein, partial [Dehalococcoidia bacterium]|nr:DUF4255 domain-containing protein [Dehalococcoidia bacterium]